MPDPITVLYVTGDPESTAVTGALERERDAVTVLTACGGGDALDRLDEADVDCVVTDYALPDTDGLELLDAVRAGYGDLPFVLYADEGSEAVASQAISAGVTDYVRGRDGDDCDVLAERVADATAASRSDGASPDGGTGGGGTDDDPASAADALSRYERLVDTMNDGAYVLDADGVVTETNETLTLLTGYTREELVGSHVSAFVDDDAVERGRECVRSLLSAYGPEVEVFEATVEHASGDRFPAEVTVSLLPYADEFRGTIGVVDDVSSREHAKARLREERRKIAELHEVATAMEDCESRSDVYDLVVETAETVLAFDAAIVAVEDDGVLVPGAVSEDIRPRVVDHPMPVDEGVAGRVFETGESRVVADGAEADDARDVMAEYSSVLTVPFGDVGVFQAMSTDADAFDDRDRELAELLVSHAARTVESLAARAELATRAEKYRTVVEESRDPMAIVRDGAFAFVNRTTADTLGASRDALLGTPVLDVVHPEDRDAVVAALDDGRTDTVEARVETADGVRHYEVSAREITYEGEQAVLASARDITERVEAKRELQHQNERLEEFARVVSHDLRNPLTVALTALDGARQGMGPDALDRVESALRRMEQLIDDLLTLAREGEVVDETERVPVGDAAHRAWGSVATADATLRIGTDGAVAADESRLVELFENLFSNAVEHAGPEVRVEVGVTDDGFYVADDGEGVPEDGDAVFEHGYTTADDGTGFGLSIVAEVASAHGWQVSVSESESGGARFQVTGVETGI